MDSILYASEPIRRLTRVYEKSEYRDPLIRFYVNKAERKIGIGIDGEVGVPFSLRADVEAIIEMGTAFDNILHFFYDYDITGDDPCIDINESYLRMIVIDWWVLTKIPNEYDFVDFYSIVDNRKDIFEDICELIRMWKMCMLENPFMRFQTWCELNHPNLSETITEEILSYMVEEEEQEEEPIEKFRFHHHRIVGARVVKTV